MIVEQDNGHEETSARETRRTKYFTLPGLKVKVVVYIELFNRQLKVSVSSIVNLFQNKTLKLSFEHTGHTLYTKDGKSRA